jgi:hypothetical protein
MQRSRPQNQSAIGENNQLPSSAWGVLQDASPIRKVVARDADDPGMQAALASQPVVIPGPVVR